MTSEQSQVAMAELRADLAQTKRALAEMQAEVERLRSRRSHLLAMAIHDLRTPLAIIQGYSQLLEVGLSEQTDPETREYVNTIVAHSGLLQNIIENLVAMDQLNRGEFSLRATRCDLNALAGTMLARIAGLAAIKNIAIEGHMSPSPIWVRADADQIGRALYSLFSYLERLVRPEGRMLVEIRDHEGAGCISLSEPDRSVPPEGLTHLFGLASGHEEASPRHFDIGLVVAARVIEAHGGHVDARSTPDGGLIFSLYLPYAEAES